MSDKTIRSALYSIPVLVGMKWKSTELLWLFWFQLTYHCELCRKNFQNRFNLKRHRIGIHSGPGGQFQCEICNKYFHYQSNLSRHRKDVHRSGDSFPLWSCPIILKDLDFSHGLKKFALGPNTCMSRSTSTCFAISLVAVFALFLELAHAQE